MSKVLHIVRSSDVIEVQEGFTYYIYSHDAGFGLAKLSEENKGEINFLIAGHLDPNLLVEVLQKYKFPKKIVTVELDSAEDKRCWLKPAGAVDNTAFCIEVKKQLDQFGYQHVFDTYEGRIVNSNKEKKWKSTNSDSDKEKDNF